MTSCLGKSCSFGLPRVPFANCCQFMYLVISLLVLRAGCGIWLYRLLIIAYLLTLEDIFDLLNYFLKLFSFIAIPCKMERMKNMKEKPSYKLLHMNRFSVTKSWWGNSMVDKSSLVLRKIRMALSYILDKSKTLNKAKYAKDSLLLILSRFVSHKYTSKWTRANIN